MDWFLGWIEVWGNLSRRGTHVNSPKIGSRGTVFIHWRNVGFYADLRRELVKGTLF
jgi:hypothetical protein